MRSEKRACACVLLQMLNHRPGDGQAVKGRGPTAHFVEQGYLAHFHQKCRASAGQIVARADARKNPVGDRQFRLARRHKRAHLRENRD